MQSSLLSFSSLMPAKAHRLAKLLSVRQSVRLKVFELLFLLLVDSLQDLVPALYAWLGKLLAAAQFFDELRTLELTLVAAQCLVD